jgi:hypothetical protein
MRIPRDHLFEMVSIDSELRSFRKDLPIDTLVVALGANNLRSEVIGRTAKSPGDVRNLLGKSKIGNLEMPMSVQEQVLGLEIAVDDVHAVEVVQCQCDLCSVEFGYRVGESLGGTVSREFKTRQYAHPNGLLETFGAG